MATHLYHEQLGIPVDLDRPQPGHPLHYSVHATNEARKDRADALPRLLPPTFTLIELEANDSNQVVKWVVRIPCHTRRQNKWLDLVVAVQPDGTVRTAWLNCADDDHRTLDETRYRKVTA